MKRVLTLALALCLTAPAAFAQAPGYDLLDEDQFLEIRSEAAEHSLEELTKLQASTKGMRGAINPMDQLFVEKTLQLLERGAQADQMTQEELLAHVEDLHVFRNAMTFDIGGLGQAAWQKMGPEDVEPSCSRECLTAYTECREQLAPAGVILEHLICDIEIAACTAACLLH